MDQYLLSGDEDWRDIASRPVIVFVCPQEGFLTLLSVHVPMLDALADTGLDRRTEVSAKKNLSRGARHTQFRGVTRVENSAKQFIDGPTCRLQMFQEFYRTFRGTVGLGVAGSTKAVENTVLGIERKASSDVKAPPPSEHNCRGRPDTSHTDLRQVR